MRLALVGCGAAAEYFHLPAIRSVLGDGDIWLVDPDRNRARALARRRDHVSATHDALPGEVDLAIVAVPNDLHAPVAGDLLRAGVHVLCEKPLGRTATEAREVAAAAADSGAILAVGHFRRFFSSIHHARNALASGELGRPRTFVADEGFVFEWEAHSAYSLDRKRAGGGVLLDVGTHVLDQLRAIFGELEVRSYLDDAHGGIEADCVVELTSGETQGRLELSRTRALGSTLVVECEQGKVTAPLATDGPIEIARHDGSSAVLGEEKAGGGYAAAFEAQLRDVVAAIESSGAPAAGAADALAVAAIVDRCYAQRLPLPEPWVEETTPR